MTLRSLLLTASIVALSAPTAYAESTKSFVHDASIANRFEIESSKVALDKSRNKEVKTFAKTMIADHTKTGKKMQEVLVLAHTDLKPEKALDKKHVALLKMLKNAPSERFDSQYLTVQTEAHKQAIDLFDDYADDGKDGPLKTFAAETLPTLKGHLTHIEQLSTKH